MADMHLQISSRITAPCGPVSAPPAVASLGDDSQFGSARAAGTAVGMEPHNFDRLRLVAGPGTMRTSTLSAWAHRISARPRSVKEGAMITDRLDPPES